MRLLLDSHALFWILTDPKMLPKATLEASFDEATETFFSAVACYELAWKSALGKLAPFPLPVSVLAVAQGFDELPIAARHADFAACLGPIHRGP